MPSGPLVTALFTPSGTIVPLAGANYGQADLNGSDSARFWMLVVTGDSNWSTHSIAHADEGGMCIGMALDSNNNARAVFVPCIVDSKGDPVTASTTGSVVYNPKGMWMSQDSLVQAFQPFPILSVSGAYGVSVYDNDPDGQGSNYITQVTTASSTPGNPASLNGTFFTSAPSQSTGAYKYTNLNFNPNSDFHLGCTTPPSSNYFFDGKTFDGSIPIDVLQMSGMNGGQIESGVWVEIRSLPYNKGQANSLAAASNTCPFENPNDMHVGSLDKPGSLFCCSGSSSILVKDKSLWGQVSVGCSNQTMADLLLALDQPPAGRSTSVCHPGTYGSGCALTCANGSSLPNCGCFPGLVAQPDGTCKLPDPNQCLATNSKSLLDIQSSGCVCADGYYGKDCSSNVSQPVTGWQSYITIPNVLLGAGLLALVGAAYVYYKQQQQQKKQKQITGTATSSEKK